MPRPLPSLPLFVAVAVSLFASPARGAGGPDAYGYTWKSGTDVGGPDYDYHTFPNDSTYELSLDYGTEDDGVTELTLPFDFDFYGITTDTLWFYTNGLLTFDAHTTGTNSYWYENQALSLTTFPVIAAWWDDLIGNTNSPPRDWDFWGLYQGTAPNRTVILEWYQINHYSDLDNDETASFQIHLHESTHIIEFMYADVETGDSTWYRGISASVGITSGEPGEYLEFSFNESSLSNGMVLAFYPPSATDDDGDGYTLDEGDCDDGDEGTHPGATESCDGVADNNCDGIDDPLESDGDGDGYSECGGDCNDSAAAVRPGAVEVCDGVDQDCDGVIDDGLPTSTWYPDLDEDGYGNTSQPRSDCSDPGDEYIATSGDCNDANEAVHPGAALTCDEILDNNCDGAADTLETDGDGDGLSECDGDCDDSRASVYPDAEEICDASDDNDCDGLTDSMEADADGDGLSLCDGDCDDSAPDVFPGNTEPCDGIDNNCNGEIDESGGAIPWYADTDEDGFGDDEESLSTCTPPPGYVDEGGDCDDGDPAIHPGAGEVCDEIDNDCDGTADEGLAVSVYYPDGDGDGYGESEGAVAGCGPPDGYADEGGDCDDSLALVHPGAVEICVDGLDNDCDGDTDAADSECPEGDDDTPSDDDSTPDDDTPADDDVTSDDDTSASDDDTSGDDDTATDDDSAGDDDSTIGDDDTATDDDDATAGDDDDDNYDDDSPEVAGCNPGCDAGSGEGPISGLALGLTGLWMASLRRRNLRRP